MMRFVAAVLFSATVVFSQSMELTAPSGNLKSPNYPSNYPSNERLAWNIVGQAGKTISLTFDDDFNVKRSQCSGCSCDSVTVYDGEDKEATILIKACGTTAPSALTSSGHNMFVEFVSDNTKQAKGFSASYKVGCSEATCGDGTCIPNSAKCDGEYHCTDKSDEDAVMCSCGNPSIRPSMPSFARIVGGQEAREHSYPWMVAVVSSSSGGSGQYCGGSIIGDQWILTAAHCMEGEAARDVHIKAGAHVKYSSNEGAQMRTASNIYIHHAYDNYEMDSDVALIKLASPLQFGEKVNKVCLPDSGRDLSAGEDLVVTGWGAITEGGSASNKLLEVTVPVISNSQCSSMYGSSYPITDTMMCAGFSAGGKDSCQGDSGGPVVHSSNGASTGTFTQVGVVSWGIGCARAGKPGVYAKVSAIKSWIDDTMSSN